VQSKRTPKHLKIALKQRYKKSLENLEQKENG